MMEYMYKSMRRLRREDSGFTLIELLIVILILGILAGIAIFASGPFRTAAADACELANDRIDIVANAAEDAGIDRGAMFEAERGDCEGSSGGGGGGGGGGLTAAAVGAAVTGGASANPTAAQNGELLVAIAVMRQGEDGTFPGSPTASGWDPRGVAGFKTAGSTADRRAIAVFTKEANGSDNFAPSWPGAAVAHVVVQRFNVTSGSPTSFQFAPTHGNATATTTLALNGAAGGSGNSLMVVGLGARNDATAISGFNWNGPGSAGTASTTGGVYATMASQTVSGAGPHSATPTWTNAKHASGFVLVIR